MVSSLSKDSSTVTMLETLKSEGVFKIDSFYPAAIVEELYKETMTLIDKKAGDYEFGKNLRGGDISKFKDYPVIYAAFSAKWMKDLNGAYVGNNNNYCKEIYATYDYLNTKGLGRNGYLHFDRFWAFKFFIYLTDIDKTNGAFSCVPGSHIKGKELREGAWNATHNYAAVKNRILYDYDNMKEYETMIEPVEAKAGTVIVFDTDVFHMGGKVEDGKKRLVIRSHNRK